MRWSFLDGACSIVLVAALAGGCGDSDGTDTSGGDDGGIGAAGGGGDGTPPIVSAGPGPGSSSTGLPTGTTGTAGTGGAGGGGGHAPGVIELDLVVEDLPGHIRALAVGGPADVFLATDSTLGRCTVLECPTAITPIVEDTLVSERALLVHEDHLYWGTSRGVFRTSTTADGPVELLAEGDITRLAVDDTSVVHAHDRELSAIVAVAPGEEAVVVVDGVVDPSALIWSGGSLFFSIDDVELGESGVYGAPATGGEAPVRLDGGHAAGPVRDVAVDGERIYWVDDAGVRRCPRSGCADEPETMLGPEDSYRVLTIAGDELWAGGYFGTVDACDVDDCAGSRRTAHVFATVVAMAWNEGYVYFTSGGFGNGRIHRVARGLD